MWGQFKLGDIFEVKSYKKKFDANKVEVLTNGKFPYVVRMSLNNGQKGFINEDKKFLNEGNTISFGQDTATMFYQEKPYFTGDKIKILKAKDKQFNKKNAPFFLATMRKSFSSFSWGTSSFNVDIIKNQIINLPISKKGIDYKFMENFISNLNSAYILELKEKYKSEINAYLSIIKLKEYELNEEEKKALGNINTVTWETFNLKDLFGKSTRGKRLKSSDRIPGDLPFVTAGETNQGISDYIGNLVTIFSENTVTIDMFGSAKYRNYKYGGDDHIAVVNTEKLEKYAAIFVTAAIHKISYTGKFNYGRNFYAKDADDLNISLPTKNNRPDYEFMVNYISAVHKLVIKDINIMTNKEINATIQVINT